MTFIAFVWVFVLLFNSHHGKVYHYRIWQNKSSEFSVDDNIHFQTLEELVEFYKKSQGG